MFDWLHGQVTSYFFWGEVGFFFGCIVAIRNLVHNKVPFPLAVVSVTAGIYAGLIGTRILHVAMNQPNLLIQNPLLAIAFWQGNLSWMGGPPTGILTVTLIMLVARRPVWPNLGACAPGLALAHAIARIGCLVQGCCHGAPTALPWAIYSQRIHAMAHPTQIYSMIGELLNFAILQWLFRKPEYRKYLVPLYALILGAHRFASEGFRGTPPGPELIAGLRFYQSMSLIFIALGLCGILIMWRPKKGAIMSAGVAGATILLFVFLRPASEAQVMRIREGADRYLVVTRSMFSKPLDAWIAHRESQGFSVSVMAWEQPPTTVDVRNWIASQDTGSARYILVVGDAGGDGETGARWHMPTIHVESGLGIRSDQYDADSLYGDIDEDGLPDIPVGRLPVQDVASLNRQVAKVCDYEAMPLTSSWFRSVVWAGAPGFNQAMHEVGNELIEELPQWLDTFFISGYADSEASGYPPSQPETFLKAIQDPAMLSLIVSHGAFRNVEVGKYDEKPVFLAVEHVDLLPANGPLGPMGILACDAGTYCLDSGEQCLAEAFVNHPGGPIATVAATTTMYPLTNYYFVKRMVDGLEARPEGWGDLILACQRDLAKRGRRTLAELSAEDRVAQAFMGALPDTPLHTKRGVLAQEILSYSILGDPAVPLHIPSPTECSIMMSDKGAVIATGDLGDEEATLFVEEMKPNAPAALMPADLPRKAREEAFDARKERRRLVHQQQAGPGAWRAEFQIGADYHASDDCLRFLFLSPRPLYFISQDKPFAPELYEKYGGTPRDDNGKLTKDAPLSMP